MAVTIKELKQRLKTAWQYKTGLDEAMQYLNYLRAVSCGVKGTDYGKLPVHGGPVLNRIEEAVARIDEYERKVADNLNHYVLALNDIDDLIDLLSDETQKAVIRRRYQQCQTWEMIAEKMAYAVSHIHRIHGTALKNLMIVLNNEME